MEQIDIFSKPAYRFDGPEYDEKRDNERLSSQYEAVFNLMRDGVWRTLSQIHKQTGHPEASVSAQLRHARKARFGSHTVNRRYVGNGLYEYQLVENLK